VLETSLLIPRACELAPPAKRIVPPGLNVPAVVEADALVAVKAVPAARASMARRMHHRRSIQAP
jgi:hypothetical protein